jgi:hypothetical protein
MDVRHFAWLADNDVAPHAAAEKLAADLGA